MSTDLAGRSPHSVSRKDDGLRRLVDYSTLPTGTPQAAAVRAAHQVYEHVIALWAPAIIEAAHELDLFSKLAAGKCTIEEVATARETDPRATRVMLEALHSYGFLERFTDGESVHYLLPEEFAEVLLPGGSLSLVGKFAYDKKVAWRAWQGLAETVRKGTHTPAGEDLKNGITESDYEDLVTGINFWAPPVVDRIGSTLTDMGWRKGEPVSVLDVGCGTGLYSQLLLQRFPDWRAVGLDALRIVPLAEDQAKRLEVGDRFTGAVTDIWKGDWGQDVDLVLLCNMIHLQTRESGETLLRKAAATLAEGGLICIVDQISSPESEDAAQDRFAALFAASMLATGGGDAYTLDTCDEWFAASGLRRVGVVDAPMHRIVIAETDI